MKIILTENVRDLGQIGDTLEVKHGYARNFLIPKNMAVLATAENLKQVDELKKKKVLAFQEEFEKMRGAAERLKNRKMIIEAKADEKGNLFAGINSKNIADSLKKQGIEVEPDFVLISEPIKKLGVYAVLFKYYDVESTFEVEVVTGGGVRRALRL